MPADETDYPSVDVSPLLDYGAADDDVAASRSADGFAEEHSNFAVRPEKRSIGESTQIGPNREDR